MTLGRRYRPGHERPHLPALRLGRCRVGERHLRSVLSEYVRYFYVMRPHQGLGQRILASTPRQISGDASRVVANPVLGGLHHDYRAAA